jgi:putative hydrolase of the HAD superfamily
LHLALSPAEADALRRSYFLTYGTTMRGLQINHHIDPDEFLHLVHDIPLRDHIRENPRLDAVLARINLDKVIFTNASREHAEAVLSVLGIRHHFSRIVDVRDMEFQSKPQPDAYQRICDLLAVRPAECVLVEDNTRNIEPAKALGMATILVHDGQPAGDPAVDYAISTIEEIGDVVDLILGRPPQNP